MKESTIISSIYAIIYSKNTSEDIHEIFAYLILIREYLILFHEISKQHTELLLKIFGKIE